MRFSFLFDTFPQSFCSVLFRHFPFFPGAGRAMGKRAASASVDVRCSHGKCHLKDNNGGRCYRRSPQSSEKFAFFSLAPLGAAFKVELKFKLL